MADYYRSIMLVLACYVLSVWADPAAGDEKFVRSFLSSHCADCHDDGADEGDFELARLATDNITGRVAYASILERLRARDMPPPDEPRPDAKDAARTIQWIAAKLDAPLTEPATYYAVRSRPEDGNRLPHAILFGGPRKPSVPPPPRLWRLSPSGYNSLLKAIQVRHAHAVKRPFGVRSDRGIKDYADLYSVDGIGTGQLMRNAEDIVKNLLDHELIPLDKPHANAGWPREGRTDEQRAYLKGKDAVRVLMRRRPSAYGPLLHPKLAPSREDLEAVLGHHISMVLARDPQPEEIDRLIAFYEKGIELGDRMDATTMMLTAPLLTPEALHRFELGRGGEVRPGVHILSPREIAFAVSLSLSHRREKGLFEAASKGELTTREDVGKHVRRLLDDPKFAKPRLLGFFREYFGYHLASEVFKDELPDHIHSPGQFVMDTDLLILTILERDQNVFEELLTTRQSFVRGAKQTPDSSGYGEAMGMRNQWWPFILTVHKEKPVNPHAKGRTEAEVAYGFNEWPANQPVDLPGDRIGILMQPSWLVAWSENFNNDVVRRARWVREHLLGGSVPPLPLDVQAVIPEDPHRTLRDRLGATRDAACWKCHRKMDDLGLPFEGFDHFGRPRLAERVVDLEATAKSTDKKKKVFRGAPLDTSGRIAESGVKGLDGPVKDAAEMIRRLAASDHVRQVFIRHVFRYYLGRNETPGDAVTLQEADKAYLESGGSFKELLVTLLSSESFLYRTVPTNLERKESEP